MSDRYLHEGETLLCNRRSSFAVLIVNLLRGILEGVIMGSILSAALAITLVFTQNAPSVLWMYVALFVVCLAIILLQRIHIWREATFRVTTERILVANPQAFFHVPLTTIKWPQYQESEPGRRSFLDIFFFARPINIRFGTADAKYTAKFPSLGYAEDLKHYLDKVDAAVRKNETSSLKPFVARPRGKRDAE